MVTSWEDLRPEVRLFALAMETKLREHDDRPGWKQDNPFELFFHLEEELEELRLELDALLYGARKPGESGPILKMLLDEAADVGNLAMMVADTVGALKPIILENGVVVGLQHVE